MISPVKSDPEQLTQRHKSLTHTDMLKVTSHVQREDGEWIINTVMIEGYDVPFKYRRKKRYKCLEGQRVNMTYYPATENVAGMEFEVMNVVRIKVS
jgi:hypothetical protein